MYFWNTLKSLKCKLSSKSNYYMWRFESLKLKKHYIKVLFSERGEFGMSSIIGIAIGLIIAAFILIPGIQSFANKIMSDMQLWWTNSISTQIFPK